MLWLHLCRRDGCVLLHRAADAQVPAEEVEPSTGFPHQGKGDPSERLEQLQAKEEGLRWRRS